MKKRESPDFRSPVVGIYAVAKYRQRHGFLLHTKMPYGFEIETRDIRNPTNRATKMSLEFKLVGKNDWEGEKRLPALAYFGLSQNFVTQ